MPAPDLLRLDPPGQAAGLVLLLHGGKPSSVRPVDGRSASWRRARWMQHRITPRAHADGVATWLLRYRHRGWNAGTATEPSPVADVRWALEEVRRELGPVPVVLLGHSMGARAAVSVADDPLVTGVVALAPWLPADAPVETLAGRWFAAAHGRRDRITSLEATEAFVRRARTVAAGAELVDMGRAGHYMLRRAATWDEVALSRSLAFLRDHAEGRPQPG